MTTRVEAAGLAAGQPDAPASGDDRPAAKPPKQGRGLMSDGRRRSPVAIVVMAALVVLWLLPTIGLLVTSLRDRTEATQSGWWTVLYDPGNFGFTFENYSGVLEGTDIGSGFINSLVVAIPATVIPIMFAAFAAYAFTFMNFRGKDVLFIAIVAVMVVPIQVAFQPMLNLLGPRGLDITGEYFAVWLLHTGFGMPLAIYTLRNYMTTLPRTVIESAKIDGASHFQTFWRLIVPMSVPALAAFAILQFLWVWNDLLIASLFLGSGENSTVIVELQGLIGTAGLGQELLTAGAFISMALPMVVFFGLQRFFVRGLTSGAVKG
jgi:alpha-glucoside transport system permease protein